MDRILTKPPKYTPKVERVIGRPGTMRRRIYDYILENPGEIREHVADVLGLDQKTVTSRLSELVQSGAIQHIGRINFGHNAPIKILEAVPPEQIVLVRRFDLRKIAKALESSRP